MAGISFDCGSFIGSEKAGSAIAGVLDQLEEDDPDMIQEVRDIADRGHGLISEEKARRLLPLLVSYRARLVTEIGHDNWVKADEADVAGGLDPVKAKWGAGRGWRLLCTTDLIRACKASIAEHLPIAVLLW